jgi:hypothetical protein
LRIVRIKMVTEIMTFDEAFQIFGLCVELLRTKY